MPLAPRYATYHSALTEIRFTLHEIRAPQGGDLSARPEQHLRPFPLLDQRHVRLQLLGRFRVRQVDCPLLLVGHIRSHYQHRDHSPVLEIHQPVFTLLERPKRIAPLRNIPVQIRLIRLQNKRPAARLRLFQRQFAVRNRLRRSIPYKQLRRRPQRINTIRIPISSRRPGASYIHEFVACAMLTTPVSGSLNSMVTTE